MPIIPGVMPIHNYESFCRIVRFCRTDVPASITAALEPIKNDDEAVKRYGAVLAAEMCGKLFALGCGGVHFYTLNLEQVVSQVTAHTTRARAALGRAGRRPLSALSPHASLPLALRAPCARDPLLCGVSGAAHARLHAAAVAAPRPVAARAHRRAGRALRLRLG